MKVHDHFRSKFNFFWTLIFLPGFIIGVLVAFQQDIDHTVHATVVGRCFGRYDLVKLLCKMNGDDDVWNTFYFVDVNDARDRATEAKHQKILDALPEWAKIQASPTAHPKVYRKIKTHRKFDEIQRKKVDRVFRKMWRDLRKSGFDYKSGVGETNHYSKRCIDETMLPMMRYLKRSLNVWAQSFIDDCTDTRAYENDEVWRRGQLGTDEISNRNGNHNSSTTRISRLSAYLRYLFGSMFVKKKYTSCFLFILNEN